jgi:Putative restriction endonuclease
MVRTWDFSFQFVALLQRIRVFNPAREPGSLFGFALSLIRFARLAGGRIPKGWIKIAPDLAVEVVSPNENAEKLEEKLEDYRKVGVPLVWVIYPNSRRVRVFRSNGLTSLLHEDDDLSGEDIIPGFRCPLHEIFVPREPSPEVAERPTGPNGHGL